MPPRSRTKPGSTNRRPKVAGRQHAHAGTATRRADGDPDLLDTGEAPDELYAPAVDDREVASAPAPEAGPHEAPADDAGPADDATPGTTATTTSEDAPAADPAAMADTTVLPTATTEAPAPESTSDTGTTGTSPAPAGTAPADASDETSGAGATAVDTTTGTADDTPATDAAAGTTGAADTATADTADPDTVAGDTATDGPDATPDATSRTAAVPPTRGKRKRGGMAPRSEAASTASAPTRERPARRGRTADDTDDDTATAAPTRTAKPTRTGGRRTAEPEAEPRTGRLAGVRGALTRFGRSRALPVTLVVVTVVCLVLAGLAFWQGRQAWTDGPVANDAVVDVGATAELVGQSREAVERIFSYDYTRLDDSVEAARTMSANPFTDRYLQVFDQTIRVPAQQQQLKQTATVVNIGVMTLRDDRAEVMALAQFSAQRTSTGQSTNAPGLLRLQMERVDGRWRLAELTPLQAPR